MEFIAAAKEFKTITDYLVDRIQSHLKNRKVMKREFLDI